MSRILILVLAILGVRLWIAPLNRPEFSRLHLESRIFSKSKITFQEPDLIALLTSIRQELVAGITVNQAISNAVHDQNGIHFKSCKEAIEGGSDLLLALESDAKSLGNPAVNQLVKILQVNRTSGASINSALDMMIRAALSKQEMNYQISAELAGVKATITVLSLLPLVGTLLGLLMGINVVYWLATNPAGWFCLVLAMILEAGGLIWVRKLIRSVDPSAQK